MSILGHPCNYGPPSSNFLKPSKTHVVVKAECLAAAARIFEGTRIQLPGKVMVVHMRLVNIILEWQLAQQSMW